MAPGGVVGAALVWLEQRGGVTWISWDFGVLFRRQRLPGTMHFFCFGGFQARRVPFLIGVFASLD
jgi:hypothetical protein